MFFSVLPERSLLAVCGGDAIAFLQGLITNDAKKLEQGQAIYAALLSPQGKYLHDFFLVPRDGRILIDCNKARRDDLINRLKLYKLRSNVTIDVLPETVTVAWGAKPSGAFYADPRLSQLGWRSMGDVTVQGERSVPEAYDRLRLTLGIPDHNDLIVDKSILLEWGFEDLHAIDFKKGCYVGQEIIARVHYKGQIRKFVHQVRAESPLPPRGTPVHAGEALAGELRSSADSVGLALLRLEEVEKAAKQNLPLMCGGIPLSARIPDWVIHKPLADMKEQ